MWLKTSPHGEPEVLVRSFRGQQSISKNTGRWQPSNENEMSGIGGSADWDLISDEEAAEVLRLWGVANTDPYAED
jgi:hypothetical protein